MSIAIEESSVKSLLLGQLARGHELGTASGFVVIHNGRHYLITNWHVVAGRRPDTGELLSPTGAVPDELGVMHNKAGQVGVWEVRREPLYGTEGDPLWLEHPIHNKSMDVVAVPLENLQGIDVYPYDPENPGPPIRLTPSEQVSIIGFPFGKTGGGALGIWVQGTVASEPVMDWNDLPCFLVDSRTRQGQSGSPVILQRAGSYLNESGTTVFAGDAIRFIGVYSGRISQESDLGIVWKVEALSEILSANQRGPKP